MALHFLDEWPFVVMVYCFHGHWNLLWNEKWMNKICWLCLLVWDVDVIHWAEICRYAHIVVIVCGLDNPDISNLSFAFFLDIYSNGGKWNMKKMSVEYYVDWIGLYAIFLKHFEKYSFSVGWLESFTVMNTHFTFELRTILWLMAGGKYQLTLVMRFTYMLSIHIAYWTLGRLIVPN